MFGLGIVLFYTLFWWSIYFWNYVVAVPIKSLLQQVMFSTFFLACLMLRFYCLHQTWDQRKIRCNIRYIPIIIVHASWYCMQYQCENPSQWQNVLWLLPRYVGDMLIHLWTCFILVWMKPDICKLFSLNKCFDEKLEWFLLWS